MDTSEPINSDATVVASSEAPNDPDVALAQVLQEQEEAWFLFNNHSGLGNTSTLADRDDSVARETGSSVQTEGYVAHRSMSPWCMKVCLYKRQVCSHDFHSLTGELIMIALQASSR
jgi:hypothetical protein